MTEFNFESMTLIEKGWSSDKNIMLQSVSQFIYESKKANKVI